MTVAAHLKALALAALAAVANGCNFANWRSLDNPGVNQAVRVESGDRLRFDLEENGTTGYLWWFECKDSDVEVRLDHHAAERSDGLCGAPGHAHVEIRVHRGYDGPSAVRFYCKRSWETKPIREFTVTLFKRTEDRAFWE